MAGLKLSHKILIVVAIVLGLLHASKFLRRIDVPLTRLPSVFKSKAGTFSSMKVVPPVSRPKSVSVPQKPVQITHVREFTPVTEPMRSTPVFPRSVSLDSGDISVPTVSSGSAVAVSLPDYYSSGSAIHFED